MRRLLLTALLTTMAPAWPAGASPLAREEAIREQVRLAATRLQDAPFQATLGRLNRRYAGQRVRRSGWVVATTADAGVTGLVAVHVASRPEMPGPTWTAYLTEGYGIAPGDQLTWEGVIRRIDAAGELHLREERIIEWLPRDKARFGDGRPRWEGDPPTIEWMKRGLSARPLLRRTDPTMPSEALQDYVTREVLIRIWVSPAGHVARAAVLRGSGRRDVDQAAVEAVSTWRFAPWPSGPGLDQVDDVVVPVSPR